MLPATSSSLKRAAFDWDLEDEDDLLNDDIGEDTVFGLDDFFQEKKQQQEDEKKKQKQKQKEPSAPPRNPEATAPTVTKRFMDRIYTGLSQESSDMFKLFFDDEDEEVIATQDQQRLQRGLNNMDLDDFDYPDYPTSPELLPPFTTRNAVSSNMLDKGKGRTAVDNEATIPIQNHDDHDHDGDHDRYHRYQQQEQEQEQQEQQREEEKQLKDYTKPPRTGSFLTATCPRSGKPLFFPLHLKAKSRSNFESIKLDARKNSKTGLLAMPVRLMMEQLDINKVEKARTLEREHRQQEKRKGKKKRQIVAESQALWVEKYKPMQFMDLLGDQRVNREALRWVKQWDYCVFGKKLPTETQRDKVLRQYKATFGTSMANQYEKKYKEEDDNPKDPLLRPDRKILLLSGPPGFGKTTLAHVIAAHAGYNIVEVNASDDRTGEVVKTKIKSALEMQAILRKPSDELGQKNQTTMYTKPNLLIIDEIDGASSGGGSDSFIKQLVDLATIEAAPQYPTTSLQRKNKKKQQPLLRPIICICNDVYAPVLRPLRMIAHHIQFRKVPMLTISKRLQDICSSEGLDTDLRALGLLAEMTDGDLRSCLNTLQFIRSKSVVFSKEMLKEDTGGLGKKDMGRSLFATWEELFTAPNSKMLLQRSMRGLSIDRYVQRLEEAVSSCGDMDKLMQGCFEAYPLMKFHDEAMMKVQQLGGWLDFYDHLDHRANNLHDFSVYGYMPYTIINFHRFFAGSVIQEHRMEYPKVEYEMFAKKKSYDNLVNIFVSGIHPSQRRFLTREQLVMNIVPRLLRIISPDLRPVNKHLIKPKEKEVLARLVNVMIDYGMTFVQQKTEDGQFSYTLEPPMEELIWFEGHNQKSVLTSRYAVRQLVTQEIEIERLRRRELAMGELYNDPKKGKNANGSSHAKQAKRPEKEADLVARDFFGRPIVSKQKKSTTLTDNTLRMEDPVIIKYKYHEGFSNAVKKPMTVQMFL